LILFSFLVNLNFHGNLNFGCRSLEDQFLYIIVCEDKTMLLILFSFLVNLNFHGNLKVGCRPLED
jgi:hypothetical protein